MFSIKSGKLLLHWTKLERQIKVILLSHSQGIFKYMFWNLPDPAITNLNETKKIYFTLYWLPMLKLVEFAWDIPNVTFEWFKYSINKTTTLARLFLFSDAWCLFFSRKMRELTFYVKTGLKPIND